MKADARVSIDRVILNNFQCHENLEAEFKAGINVLSGPNGSGKTAVLRAVRFGLTGRAPDGRSKTDLLGPFGDDGTVELQFRLDGNPGVLRRHLKSEKVSGEFGGEAIKSATSAAELLSGLSGATYNAAVRWVFVQAGEVDAVLFDPDAERKKTFAFLFGTHGCQAVADACQKKAALLASQAPPGMAAGLRKELDTEVAPALTEAGLLRQREIASAPEAGRVRQARDLLEQDKAIRRLWDESRRDSDRRNNLRRELDALQFEVKKANLASADLNRTLEDIVDDVLAARRRLKACKDWDDKHSHRLGHLDQEMQASLAVLKVKDLVPPEPGFTEKAAKEVSDAEMKLVIDRAVAVSDKEGRPCPACGGKLTQPVVGRSVDRLKTAEGHLAILRKDTQHAVREWEKESRAYWDDVNEKKRAESRRIELISEMNKLPARPRVEKDDQELVALADKSMRDLEESDRDLQGLHKELDAKKALLSEIESRKGDGEAPMDDQSVGREEKILEDDEAVRRRVSEIGGRVHALQERKDALLKRLAEAEKAESSLVPRRETAEIIQRVEKLFRRDGLPAVVAARQIPRLNAALAAHLGRFPDQKHAFTAEMSLEQKLTCRLIDGKKRFAEDLSTGQRKILGIAFRFAVRDLYAGRLGFLSLDEPSEGLDEKNRANLAVVLRQIDEESRSAGLQVFLITHHLDLIGDFRVAVALS